MAFLNQGINFSYFSGCSPLGNGTPLAPSFCVTSFPSPLSSQSAGAGGLSEVDYWRIRDLSRRRTNRSFVLFFRRGDGQQQWEPCFSRVYFRQLFLSGFCRSTVLIFGDLRKWNRCSTVRECVVAFRGWGIFFSATSVRRRLFLDYFGSLWL